MGLQRGQDIGARLVRAPLLRKQRGETGRLSRLSLSQRGDEQGVRLLQHRLLRPPGTQGAALHEQRGELGRLHRRRPRQPLSPQQGEEEVSLLQRVLFCRRGAQGAAKTHAQGIRRTRIATQAHLHRGCLQGSGAKFRATMPQSLLQVL